jgi:hypothetical protein
MVVEIIETHLFSHELMREPDRKDLQEIQSLIELALTLLGQAYQAIGNLPEAFQ